MYLKYYKYLIFITATIIFISCSIWQKHSNNTVKSTKPLTSKHLKNVQVKKISTTKKISITAISPYFKNIMGGSAARSLAEDRLKDAKVEFAKIAANILAAPVKTRAEFMVAYLSYYTGDPVTAMIQMPSFAEKLPALSDIAYEIAALSAFKLKSYPLAITYAKKIIYEDPVKQMLLADAYKNTGNIKDAMKFYQQVVTRWPHNSRYAEAQSKIVSCVCDIVQQDAAQKAVLKKNGDKPVATADNCKNIDTDFQNNYSGNSDIIDSDTIDSNIDTDTSLNNSTALNDSDNLVLTSKNSRLNNICKENQNSEKKEIMDLPRMGLHIITLLEAGYQGSYWTRKTEKCRLQLQKVVGIPVTPHKKEQIAALELFDRAHKDMLKKNNTRAAKRYKRVIRLAKRNGNLQCRARYELALVTKFLRDHQNAAELFKRTASECTYPKIRIRSLYKAGKAFMAADNYNEAIQMFTQVEKDYPEHSYADDARLNAAKAYLALGDRETFLNMVTSIPVDYPNGDMSAEALWIGAKLSLDTGNLKRAKDLLTRYYKIFPIEDHWYSAGRSGYWLGRVEEHLGEIADAADHYEYVISTSPFSFYMLMAYSRLYKLDKKRAQQLMDALAPDQPAMQTEIPSDLLQKSSRFALGVELVRMGLTSRGKRVLKDALSSPDAKPLLHRVAAELFRNMGEYSSSKELSGMSGDGWKKRYPVGVDFENWSLAYPKAFEQFVNKTGEKQDIDPALLYSVMREESGFNEKIESWANAVGLMQLILPTAKNMGKRIGLNKITRRDLKKPDINIKLGAAYLAYLKNMFNHPALIIAGYNAGEGAVYKWLKKFPDMELDMFVENIPYSQTRGYTKRVLSSYGVYNFLYKTGHPVINLPEVLNKK